MTPIEKIEQLAAEFELVLRNQVHDISNGLTHPLVAIDSILTNYTTAATEWKAEADRLREALNGMVKQFEYVCKDYAAELKLPFEKFLHDFPTYNQAKEAITNYDNKVKS